MIFLQLQWRKMIGGRKSTIYRWINYFFKTLISYKGKSMHMNASRKRTALYNVLKKSSVNMVFVWVWGKHLSVPFIKKVIWGVTKNIKHIQSFVFQTLENLNKLAPKIVWTFAIILYGWICVLAQNRLLTFRVSNFEYV